MEDRYIIKKGDCWRYGWQARYDREQNIYIFFFDGTMGSCGLYEITEEMFNSITDGSEDADEIGQKGRKLYSYVCDRCGPPYILIFDEDYKKLAPWADVPERKEEITWPAEIAKPVQDAIDRGKSNGGNES